MPSQLEIALYICAGTLQYTCRIEHDSELVIIQWWIQEFGRGVQFQFHSGVRQCVARKIFSPSFFTYQDGLSWHLHALHCKFQM